MSRPQPPLGIKFRGLDSQLIVLTAVMRNVRAQPHPPAVFTAVMRNVRP